MEMRKFRRDFCVSVYLTEAGRDSSQWNSAQNAMDTNGNRGNPFQT